MQTESGSKEETLQQKIQRLQFEIRELAEDVGKIKVVYYENYLDMFAMQLVMKLKENKR